MQACGRLVARMREQDVDRDIGAGIELDGGAMAPVMGDLGDPALDDRYVATRQIGPDIGRNVVTIGEERQPVGPIVEQPDLIVRLRAGPDEAPMLAGDFKAVAIGAGHDGRAPAFGKARNIRHLVGDAIAQDQAARPKACAIGSEDGEIVRLAQRLSTPRANSLWNWVFKRRHWTRSPSERRYPSSASTGTSRTKRRCSARPLRYAVTGLYRRSFLKASMVRPKISSWLWDHPCFARCCARTSAASKPWSW